MTDDQRAMYKAIVSVRNNEITLRWTRTQLFFLIHSAGLSLVVTQLEAGTATYLWACGIGMFLGVLWFLTTRRIGHWVVYWDLRLSALENYPPQPIRVFSGREYVRAQRGITTHHILLLLSLLFVAIWLMLFGTVLVPTLLGR